MAWTMYRLAFRLLSPLHVGHLKQGNLQRTRPYLTGKALWGALTARLTREGGSNDYQHIGKQVNEGLAFSYFFPSTDSAQVTLFPWDDERRFAWCYLNTYASTALDYERNAALEGSLHETEYLAPVTRNGEPVCLVGYIFEKREDGCNLAWQGALHRLQPRWCARWLRRSNHLAWQGALHRLQLGGERTYGWGRVGLEDKPQEITDFLCGWQVDLSGDRPKLHARSDSSAEPRAYAHVYTENLSARGLIEPFLGRETQAAGKHGQTLSQASICWAPGALLQGTQSLIIAENGLWRAAN